MVSKTTQQHALPLTLERKRKNIELYLLHQSLLLQLLPMRKIIFPSVTNGIRLLVLLCLALIIDLASYAQPFGYAYTKNVSINELNVTGTTDFADFPVLIHVVDPDLRTTANGGHVTHPSGYDIIFTLDDCSIPLYHQIERYIPTTGELLVWLRLPVLYALTNTEFKMYYGNNSILSPTESPNTWSSHYGMVHHFQQNPGGTSPQMLDGTPNGNNGTANGGMTIANSVVGKIDEALQFDGTNDYIMVPDFDYSSAPLGFTVSFWFRVVDNSGTSYQYMYSHNNYGLQHSLNVYFAETSVPVAGDGDVLKTIFMDQNDAISTEGLDSAPGYADGNWHYYTFVVGNAPGGDWVYVDATEIAALSFQGSDPFTPPGNIFLGARTDLNATRFLKGFLDEVRILNEPRSADWIKTEFDNQTTPMGFATFGPEMDAYINCLVLPVEVVNFSATANGERRVLLDWVTESEINTDYFTIERTTDGIHFETIGSVEAAGQSTSSLHYQLTDEQALQGISYYRLITTDSDGSQSFSDLKSVHFDGLDLISAFPNPASDAINFVLYSSSESTMNLIITDLTGRIIEQQIVETEKGNNLFTLPLTNYANGQYFIKIGNDHEQYVSEVIYVH